ncbi:hypothetical protein ACHAPG_004740 [Botrytis cinerea]
MESSTKSAAKGIPHTISEVPRSLAKSEAEPRSGDASLPASSSIASLVKASHTERHLEIEDKAKSPLHTTSITVREPQGPLRGARNMVGDLTNSNHLDRLPTEIQLMIIQECIPECDASRGFSVSLDCNNKILREEGQETQHTSIYFVSRTFRKLYLKHLPIMLPSFDKNSPIYIHQDTTVALKMEQLDLRDTMVWGQVQIPSCFSEIRHLAVPVKELVYYMALESSEGENLNIIQNTIGNSERLEINTINVTKIFFFEIESFINKYCCEEPHLAELPKQLICGIDPDVVRGILRRLLTRKMNELFNPSRAIADTEETQQLLEVVKNVFEQHKRSNPDDGNSTKTSTSNTSPVVEY